MADDQKKLERADRVLVWATLVALLLGGVGTLVVALLADMAG
ncbi:MAG TPA: hypothetical protein VIL47_00475 [Candidatus Bipolaricaulota bacterium]